MINIVNIVTVLLALTIDFEHLLMVFELCNKGIVGESQPTRISSKTRILIEPFLTTIDFQVGEAGAIHIDSTVSKHKQHIFRL